MSATVPTVAVCIVTYNSAADLETCLAAVDGQSHPSLEIVVVDCGSTDESLAVARQFSSSRFEHKVIELGENLGFAGGMNRAIEETGAPFILTLNPDAHPEREFAARLLGRALAPSSGRIGAVAGRLLRPDATTNRPTLDACGMKLTLTWRHLDRGSGEPDTGGFSQADRVFGATGAASLFRRAALLDVAVDDEVFLNEFHSYREDAELCFRLRARSWEIVYEPTAVCQHRRRNLPSRRREMSPDINFHSVKNRYLLRAYHQDVANLVLTLFPTAARDLLAFVYVLTRERESLAAYRWLWDNRRRILARRAALLRRRTCTSWALNRWFLRSGQSL